MSTSSVVPRPSDSTWAVKASRSLSCSSVKLWALVPVVGIPKRMPAARLEVAAKPVRYAARALAVAASSWVRRVPISMQGRSPAAQVIREPAEAIAESWLRIESSNVSSTTASAKEASTTMRGECGK